MRRKATIIGGLFILLLLLCAGLIHPVFLSSKYASLVIEPQSHLKSCHNALLTYISDYDERLPHATSTASSLAMIKPYGFHQTLGNYHKIHYNVNVAGVLLTDIDNLEGAVSFLGISRRNDLPHLLLTLDGSTHQARTQKLVESIQSQYPRKDVILAPSNYLPQSE